MTRPRRVEAGILFELNYNLTAGHSFLPEDKLQMAVSQLLSVDGEAVKEGIGRLLEADRLVRSTLAGITMQLTSTTAEHSMEHSMSA